MIPEQLMTILKAYVASRRHLDRVIKATDAHKSYLFLTRHNKPYKVAAVDREMVNLRRAGHASGLKFLQKFKFHQTRATYGTWLVSICLENVSPKAASSSSSGQCTTRTNPQPLATSRSSNTPKPKLRLPMPSRRHFLGLHTRLSEVRMRDVAISDLTFPMVEYGKLETPWDLRVLLYKGGAKGHPKSVFNQMAAGELGRPLVERLSWLSWIHEAMTARLVGGGSKTYGIYTLFRLREFFAWADEFEHAVSLETVEDSYRHWCDFLLNRVRLKAIKNLNTACTWGRCVVDSRCGTGAQPAIDPNHPSPNTEARCARGWYCCRQTKPGRHFRLRPPLSGCYR